MNGTSPGSAAPVRGSVAAARSRLPVVMEVASAAAIAATACPATAAAGTVRGQPRPRRRRQRAARTSLPQQVALQPTHFHRQRVLLLRVPRRARQQAAVPRALGGGALCVTRAACSKRGARTFLDRACSRFLRRFSNASSPMSMGVVSSGRLRGVSGSAVAVLLRALTHMAPSAALATQLSKCNTRLEQMLDSSTSVWKDTMERPPSDSRLRGNTSRSE